MQNATVLIKLPMDLYGRDKKGLDGDVMHGMATLVNNTELHI